MLPAAGAPFDAAAAAAALPGAHTSSVQVAHHSTRPDSDGAYLIYTSGTTGRPKGVLTTHTGLRAQITSLTTAWEWSGNDRILNPLPLHHVHGVMAILLCALYSGAACEFLPKFDAEAVWSALCRDGKGAPPLTLFMAVPTVYARLIQAWEAATPERQAAISERLHAPGSPLRLTVSGSAALPDTIASAWTRITGHTLLERYGMTEFGMAVSNPLREAPVAGHVNVHGYGPRTPSSVGLPLPGYSVRVVDPEGDGTPLPHGTVGELQVSGPGVFTEYWGKPAATAETFAGTTGWFKTGDAGSIDPETGYIRIAGRLSADIIKSGGYKISALDIEQVLLDHPDILECAVLGAPDAVYGERVAVLLVRRSGSLSEEGLGLKEWAKGRLAAYKIPSVIKVVESIPRNAMGKVNKRSLKGSLWPVVEAVSEGATSPDMGLGSPRWPPPTTPGGPGGSGPYAFK